MAKPRSDSGKHARLRGDAEGHLASGTASPPTAPRIAASPPIRDQPRCTTRLRDPR